MPTDLLPVNCWICKKDVARGNKDPRPHGGYPEGSMEANAFKIMNHAAMDLCEPCHKKVTEETS